jgi:serine/threonine-protein kinase
LHAFGGLWLALDDGAPALGLSQRRRLALLAMVASGGSNGLSRDRILATLWPESDAERARHALAQLVYSLRRGSGGQPLLIGDSQLRLDVASLSSDCGDLLAAAQSGDHARVAELYRGSFLDGFRLTEAPDFEHWLDTERERFRQLAARSLEALATEANASGDAAAAADAWHRRSELDPLDPKSAAGYLEALLSTGRRTAARETTGARGPDPGRTRLGTPDRPCARAAAP